MCKITKKLPQQKHMGKVVGGFGKKSCVSTCEKARKHICITDRHDMTLGIKVVLNPNTTNQYKEIVCLVKILYNVTHTKD